MYDILSIYLDIFFIIMKIFNFSVFCFILQRAYEDDMKIGNATIVWNGYPRSDFTSPKQVPVFYHFKAMLCLSLYIIVTVGTRKQCSGSENSIPQTDKRAYKIISCVMKSCLFWVFINNHQVKMASPKFWIIFYKWRPDRLYSC